METAPASPRYALYYAPAPHSRLWQFGSAVLGYDAASGQDSPSAPPMGIAADRWATMIAAPAEYGFHATIKAPFELADDRQPEDLAAALAAFAARTPPVVLGRLVPSALTRYVALLAPEAGKPLVDLAQSVVEAFEPFRAPLNQYDRARRLSGTSSERQRQQLDRFGYPFVGEDFQFHMSLAGPVAGADMPDVLASLTTRYHADVGTDVVQFDRLALFAQPSRKQRFRIIAAATLGA